MTSIFLSSESSNEQESEDFTYYFQPALTLDPNKDYEIALVNASIWYSWFNISAEKQNNKFRYNNGARAREITVPDGSYNIDDLEDILSKLMRQKGDDPRNTNINVNRANLGTYIRIRGGYSVDFTGPNTFAKILGFRNRIVDRTSDSDTLADITNVSSLLIHCNLVTGTYLNSKTSNVQDLFK